MEPYSGSLPKVIDPGHLGQRYARGEIQLSPDDIRYVRQTYHAGLAYTDHVIGGFLDTLTQEGFLDNTIVIITSDHGEELDDHGDIGHGFNLFEGTPTGAAAATRLPRQRATGADPEVPCSTHGRSADTGSALAIFRCRLRGRVDRFSMTELRETFLASVRSSQDKYAHALLENDIKTIQSDDGFYRVPRNPRMERYDLSRDPNERSNIWQPDEQAAWTQRFQQLLAEHPPVSEVASSSVILTGDHRRDLQNLGYLGGK